MRSWSGCQGQALHHGARPLPKTVGLRSCSFGEEKNEVGREAGCKDHPAFLWVDGKVLI